MADFAHPNFGLNQVIAHPNDHVPTSLQCVFQKATKIMSNEELHSDKKYLLMLEWHIISFAIRIFNDLYGTQYRLFPWNKT